jgi:hypothetical protein
MLNGNGAAHEETGEATEAPPEGAPATIDYAIVIDFEATCDSSDDELTRLQQCDTHEIIEFVSGERRPNGPPPGEADRRTIRLARRAAAATPAP